MTNQYKLSDLITKRNKTGRIVQMGILSSSDPHKDIEPSVSHNIVTHFRVLWLGQEQPIETTSGYLYHDQLTVHDMNML
jgi:hypothetical protein